VDILAFNSSNQCETTTEEGRASFSPFSGYLAIRKRLPSAEL